MFDDAVRVGEDAAAVFEELQLKHNTERVGFKQGRVVGGSGAGGGGTRSFEI